MKRLLILSGKGGTGKTTVAGAFIRLSNAKACADCDVDAPNLHIILNPASAPETEDYFGMPKAKIAKDLCVSCGLCEKSCRFGAITKNDGYAVNPYACEGCGVCEAVCPSGAVKLFPDKAGELTLYRDIPGVFSTAKLKMGSGTSGKLVAEVKKRLNNAANGADMAIIDGSPGIGCPVIASVSGVDMVLIVAEPSVSGISDMARIVRTAEGFQTKIAVCVNKYDTDIKNTEAIEAFCAEKKLPFVGRIPFDKNAVSAINSGRTVAEIDCPAGRAVKKVYERTMALLLGQREGDK